MSLFTKHHEDSMDKALAILEEAFDWVLVICLTTDDDQRKEQVTHRIRGGYVQALGMVEEWKKQQYAKDAATEIEDRRNNL